MTPSLRTWLATGSLLGALALPGLALTAPVADAAATTTPAAAPAPAKPAQPPKPQSKYVEARIADLHKALAITAAQESNFDAVANVMRDNAAKMDAASGADGSFDPEKVSAPDVLQGYAKVSEAQAQGAQSIIAPFGTLYDSLSPDQKAKADKLFRGSVRKHV